MNNLKQLEPNEVFEIFEALSSIPRESGNEKAVSDYIVKLAKEKGLEVIQEPCNNVIIKKPGSKGKETLSPVILQGHMDMVCTKVDGSTHDFENDPIELMNDGDWISANGTTLGADNGIAVSMALAIAFDPIAEHPPLELLFTVAEETGMDGANAVDGKHFKGKTLINLDAELEGFVEASCAGGINSDLLISTQRKASVLSAGFVLTIKGLKGGHSGMEIDKNRFNAIRLMARTLKRIQKIGPVELVHISGGEKMNAIAKFAEATFKCRPEDQDRIKEAIHQIIVIFQNEAELAEPQLTYVLEPSTTTDQVLKSSQMDALINLLLLMPNSVQTMSEGLPGLVESSNNMGILIDEGDYIRLVNSTRSSIQSLKEEIVTRIETLAHLVGADFSTYADYPAWPYKSHSPIRDLIQKTYKDLFDKEMGIEAIHAGLECGLLIEKLGDIDMVSFGPTMEDVHTPHERLHIDSTKRVFELLTEVLKRIQA